MDLDNTPALTPPPDVESDLSQPSSILPLRYTLCAVSLFLCLFFVAIRVYVRLRIQKTLRLDDYAVLLAAAGLVSLTAIIILAGLKGDGKHQWNVSVSNFRSVLLYINVVEILYGPTIFCAKYAILRQIEAIFFSHRKDSRMFKAVRVLIWANLAYYIAITLVYLLACIPREKIWNWDIDGHCISQQDVIVSTPAINIISDITILIIPVVEVLKRKMPLKARLSVAGIFTIGILSVVASIIGLYYSVMLKQSEDLTWHIAPLGHWVLGECVTVILVACFPYAAPLGRSQRPSPPRPCYRSPGVGESIGLTQRRTAKYGHWGMDDYNSIKASHEQNQRGCVNTEAVSFV